MGSMVTPPEPRMNWKSPPVSYHSWVGPPRGLNLTPSPAAKERSVIHVPLPMKVMGWPVFQPEKLPVRVMLRMPLRLDWNWQK